MRPAGSGQHDQLGGSRRRRGRWIDLHRRQRQGLCRRSRQRRSRQSSRCTLADHGHAPPTSPTAGPVYEETATGQVVPYAPPATAGQASGATGGSAVAAAADAPSPSCSSPARWRATSTGSRRRRCRRPRSCRQIIWAGNQIIGLPYIFGGGHASFVSPGYDCSGTVSFALHGGESAADVPRTPPNSKAGARTASGAGSRSSPTPDTPT